MKLNKKKENEGLVKSVLMAYLVLLLHVLLVACLALLILFFRGIVNYLIWIFLGGTLIILFSAWRFYRRMKAEGKTLQEILKNPIFEGREVEISLLGGLASLKVGKPDHLFLEDFSSQNKQLEDPETIRLRELNELVRLFENNLITLEEYNQAKKQIFKS
jgi:predicted membrane metal-binding protein